MGKMLRSPPIWSKFLRIILLLPILLYFPQGGRKQKQIDTVQSNSDNRGMSDVGPIVQLPK